jgi:hypothetical protein
MSKESPTTYKIGSIGEFAAWTREMVQHAPASRDTRKQWFDTEGTAAREGTQAPALLTDPETRRQWLRACLARAKRNANKKGVDFDLTEKFMEKLWKDGRCAVTGVAFSLKPFPDTFVRYPLAPSIDRILSRRGYIKDNVRLVCVAANFGMGQWGEGVFMTLARAAVEREERLGPVPAISDSDDKWKAGLQERIDAATKMLPLLPVAERQKQKRHIAGLKAALKKGLAKNRAAGAAAAETRKRNRPAAT